MGRKLSEPCELNMTAMIDVVFQLIIFFVVTFNMENKLNEEIKLEFGRNAPEIDDNRSRLVVELDKKGKVWINGTGCSYSQLEGILSYRFNRFGKQQFPILIRADKDTLHKDVKRVMDLCTKVGIWKIDFAAILKEKGG